MGHNRGMNILKSWLDEEYGRGARLARHLKVPPSFVTKMACGDKPVPFDHGASIEAFTDGAVSRKAMFPNDWRRVWPELAANDPAPADQPAEQGVANA
jgi:DNA-binding transcriptional regulator YdaS (Cro superfamily)